MTSDIGPTVLPEQSAAFVRLMSPTDDDVLEDLEEENLKRGFPMVGPEVGGVLFAVARMVGADRVFEFGSGIGYSGYWFASALPDDGLVVLTEEDESELAVAREYFERGELTDRVAFEAGDAHEAFARYDGQFDVVLIDHAKGLYARAFEEVKDSIPRGGAVIADNAMAGGTIEIADLIAVLEGEDPEMDAMTAGIAEYLQAVRADDDFDTVALPLGEGITVTVKR